MPLRVRGFQFGAATAGIKASGRPDVGVIACAAGTIGAGVFTQNRVVAAPVIVSRAALARCRGAVRGVVVNSGNANACTGARGLADAKAMAARTAAALGVPAGRVVVASTGVIGVPLPMRAVDRGIAAAAASLGPDLAPFAEAILTTDRAAKTARARAGSATLIGCTKGAGMIAPNMATTLTFVCTDARLPLPALDRAVRRAADATFNSLTVDGDTSTNDMLLVLASGAAARAPTAAEFERALERLLADLAHQLMRGGEGVHHVVTVRVDGARSTADARAVARAIATSSLVKTAIAGGDPNWGRFLAAAGNAGVAIRPDRIDAWLDRVPIVRGGCGVGGAAAERRAAAVMRRPEYTLRLHLHQGRASGHCLACDLSHEYVSINADYRT
ncbi:MAG: bifunctional glutamate N-acetyltransferase/amino-acid acetyltransferase ArgJ [Deltaproteobacteria bacterium]|nr:MAG: bifunctional glutamate N-acetyltransferase/amino-acid acetyltransferase ArgJ [Deltaproteobacteria bacterium]